jgi:hypothetical protein
MGYQDFYININANLLNDMVNTIAQKDNNLYIGGYFIDYAIIIMWNGTYYERSSYLYNPSTPVVLIVTISDNIYTVENNGDTYINDEYKISQSFYAITYDNTNKIWFINNNSIDQKVIYTKTNSIIKLDMTGNIVVYNGTEYKSVFVFTNKGDSVEIILNKKNNKWYVIGNTSVNLY